MPHRIVIALAAACLPLALDAQTTVFNDSFSGDPLDPATYPAVTATKTGWDIASSKSAPAPTNSSGLQINMVSTSSGFIEAQALFTSTPVQLLAGTNIQLTGVFTPTNVLVHASDVLSVGLFNSGGTAPVSGLINSGLSSSTTTFASGGAKGWQGYNGYVGFTAGSSKMATRAAQTGTNNTVQDLLVGALSSTAGYSTPAGVTTGQSTTALAALTNGATYTLTYTLSLSASGTTLTATCSIYNGSGTTNTGSNTLLASYTGTMSGATLLTTAFDSMAVGWRTDASLASDLNFSSLVVSTTSGPPTFTTQPPASTSVSAGNTLTLGAVVSGAASYQWQVSSDGGLSYSSINTAANPTAGTATLTIAGMQTANAGTYQLIATNAAASVSSSPAVVTVSTAAVAPSITTQPVSASAPQSGTATFTGAASGVPAPAYSWTMNGVALSDGVQADGSVFSGSSKATLTIQEVAPDENGASLVIVATNIAGTASSSGAVLTVLAPLPTITAQTSPSGQTAASGSSVSFSAAASGATSYQWIFNGSPITGNPSALTTTLTLGSLTPLSAGTYALEAINAGGATTSAPAILNVTAAAGAPVLPVIPDGDYTVTAYGAVGDGATDNTAAIQSAINAALAAGGGTVEIPAAAANYLCGPLALGSSISLQVDSGATLQALPYGTYPDVGNAPAIFISFRNASNVQIVGGGTIDGNGSGWWTAYDESSSVSRPDLVKFSGCTDVLVAGVTLSNSPIEHLVPDGCTNVTIDGTTVATPASSPNTDGIDPSGTNILIENCSIADGDDNIAVKPENTLCSNITITNCAFGAGHGLSVGGQTNSGLDGMTVTNCTFNGTLTGLRLKADATEGGPVQNITYSNITMTNVPSPIVFYSYYNEVGTPGANSGSNETTTAKVNSYNTTPPSSLTSSTIPTWQNITISNVTATGASQYSLIWGLPLANGLFTGVTLNNVSISGGTGFGIYNATNVQLTGNSSVGPIITDNALAIIGQPQNLAVSAGGTAVFSATVAGASGITGTAPTYQWQLNGANLADGAQADGSVVSGSAKASLTLSNVKVTDAGSYTLTASNNLDGYNVMSNSLGINSLPVSVTSSSAALSVQQSSATVTLSNLSQTYSGAPEAPTFTTNPAGLAVSLAYNGSGTAPTAAGSYTVVATVADPSYTGTATGTFVISKAAASLTLGALSQTYGGGIEDANVATSPPGLTVLWSYNGQPLAFTPSGGTLAAYAPAAGQTLYVDVTGAAGGAVVGSSPDFGINSDLGTAAVQAGILTVGQSAVLQVTISANGSTFTFIGIATSGFTSGPIGVGTYAVIGTIVDLNYSGAVSGNLSIAQATPVVTWSPPAGITYGTALDGTQLNAMANVPGTFTYAPAAGTILGTGANQALGVTFTPSDSTDYTTAAASTTISVSQATAAVSLSNTSQTYSGSPEPVAVTTSPANLATTVTYNGSATVPAAAGSYAVVATVTDPNYSGSASGTLTIGQATPVLSWTAPAAIPYGAALGAAQLDATSGVAGSFAYSPAAGTILSAGANQALSATFIPADSADYASGTVGTTITVNAAAATVTLGNLSQVYTGAAHSASVTTTPSGLATMVTYNGASALPVTAGSYAAVATVTNPNYTGSAAGTLVIAKATPVLSWAAPAAITAGTAIGAAQLDASSNVAGSFAYSPGSGTILPAGANQALSATFAPADSADYASGGTVGTTITVNAAAATVTLGNLSQVYTGATHSVSVTTTPSGLSTTVTYNGASALPVTAGGYAVVATVTSSGFTGSASGTLVIAKATPVLSWTAPAAISYGTALGASQLDATSSVTGGFAYTPPAGTVLKAGAGQILSAAFTPADRADYANGSVSTTITVKPATATIALGGLDQEYTGKPLTVTATTSPSGLAVSITYNGSATAPTYPGTYIVVATITDPDYSGTVSSSMAITATGLVNQAPVLNGNAAFEGSIQMLSPDTVNMSGNVYISGDLLVPGTPTLHTSGDAKVVGTINAGGAATPTNYQVNISGNALLRYLVRQVNPVSMPTVAAPPSSNRNVTLNGNEAPTTLVPGNYGTVIVNGNTTLIVGMAGTTTPSIYNIQNLILNGNGTLEVIGPVAVVVGNSVMINGNCGASANPEWLLLEVANGGVTLNGGVTFNGSIIAPEGQVIVNGNSTLNGTVTANSLLLNGGAIVDPGAN